MYSSKLKKEFLWCSGWAVDPRKLHDLVMHSWPGYTHHIIIPGQYFLNNITQLDISKIDTIIGYSLGSSLILHNKLFFDGLNKSTFLLTPFLDIKKESNLGGLLHASQLHYLRRQLLSNPIHAINDFYKRTHLKFLITDNELPYSTEELLWGVDYLIETSLKPVRQATYSTHEDVIFGSDDVLIHHEAMLPLFQRAEVFEDTTHCIQTLLPVLKNKLQ